MRSNYEAFTNANRTVLPGNLKVRLRVALSFFRAGISTLFGKQEFELNTVSTLSKKEYNRAKKTALAQMVLGEDIKRSDISASLRF